MNDIILRERKAAIFFRKGSDENTSENHIFGFSPGFPAVTGYVFATGMYYASIPESKYNNFIDLRRQRGIKNILSWKDAIRYNINDYELLSNLDVFSENFRDIELLYKFRFSRFSHIRKNEKDQLKLKSLGSSMATIKSEEVKEFDTEVNKLDSFALFRTCVGILFFILLITILIFASL